MIKAVSIPEIIPIRQAVLRPGKPVETCYFEKDEHSKSFHLGYYHDGELSGIASLLFDASPTFTAKKQYRLRGMAVLPQFRKLNIGSQLLAEAEKKCKQRKAQLLWMNAREKVIPFYEKNGYISLGNTFFIPDVGPHRLLMKAFTL